MAVIKCKMCGGDLTIAENVSVAECEYCGTKQTVPVVDDEKKITLFSRANRLRLACEFDKAAGIYESIVTEFPEEAEAYWGLVLCKYGIEYVDDPKTGKKIPTCHRSSFDSVMEDLDFEMVLEYADVVARSVYREEAKAIERIRQGILEVSAKEEPYDIFICYKETDFNGERTLDSVLAQDIYDALTEKGYRTFFARITLEDKLGQMYEPYIFAALNSAKVMLAIGTDYEYYNAVWVKNEWSRFLSLIEKGEKKTLIPCYKGLDAYDMPKEFKRLQAQDLGKVGAIQDLLRGIGKILDNNHVESSEGSRQNLLSVNAEALLKRAFIFLEDGEFRSANEYCEKVLDIDPENAQAYLVKLLVELKMTRKEDLGEKGITFDHSKNYSKIIRFGDRTLITEVDSYLKSSQQKYQERRLTSVLGFILKNKKAEELRKETLYNRAITIMENATTEEDYIEATQIFESLAGYKEASLMAEQCLSVAESSVGETARCDDLLLQLKRFYHDQLEAPIKKEQINGQLDVLNVELNKNVALREMWAQIERDLELNKDQITACQAEILRLQEENKGLGIFAVKRKKEITQQISDCESKISLLKREKSALDQKKQDFRSYEELCRKIEAQEQRKTMLKLKYEELSDISKENDLREELLKYKYGQKILNTYDEWRNIEVGDYIKLGTYNQRTKENRGVKEIEWLVLDVKNGTALVISRNLADCQPYNKTTMDVTWKLCTLRKWLNEDFYDVAFTKEEKGKILTTKVSNEAGDEITHDKVFILDRSEAEKYFCSDKERSIDRGSWLLAGYGYSGRWWLRLCSKNRFARYISEDGELFQSGVAVTCESVCVRPAMWIDLNP